MADRFTAGQVLTADALNTLIAQRQLENQELDANAASISFADIPQDFTHLEIVLSAQHAGAGFENLFLRFNGDSGTNYAHVRWGWLGDGTSNDNYNGSLSKMAVGWLGWTFWSVINVSIPRYTVAGFQKLATGWGLATGPIGSGSSNAALFQAGGRWIGTDPVTSIELTNNHGDFVAGSVATLYGRP